MVIAALLHFNPGSKTNIEAVMLSHLANQYPAHQFVFFYTGTPPLYFTNNNHARTIQVAIKTQPDYMYCIWSRFSLPRLLKKYKADVFVNCNSFVNTYIQTPQLLFFTKQFLFKNKKQAGTFSHFKKRGIAVTEKYFIENMKLADGEPQIFETGYPVAEGFTAASWQEKLSIKTEFAAGHDFFICLIHPQNKNQAITILKAFSIFKKRQKSAIRLVLLLKGIHIEEAVPEFHLYKYRHEVNIQQEINEAHTRRLPAAAFAFIAISHDLEVTDALLALHANVPIILPDTERFHKLCKDAAIYCGNEEKSIAEGMMEIYKNELLQHTLIENAQEIISFHSLAASTNKLWEAIVKN